MARLSLRSLAVLGCFGLVMKGPTAFAWGALGHQVVAEIGAEFAPKGTAFWSLQKKELSRLALVPDQVWKSGSGAKREKPTHWFQIDSYVEAPWNLPESFESYQDTSLQYGEAFVIQNGTALWRAQQFYQLSQRAFQSGDKTFALQCAGVMAHYVGDLSQPMHVSVNHDGPEGSKTGLHSFFESDLLEMQDQQVLRREIRTRVKALLADEVYVRDVNLGLHKHLVRSMQRSIAPLSDILRIDSTKGRGAQGIDELTPIALERLADGAAMYALILGALWDESGHPEAKAGINLGTPTWIAPEY